MLTAEPKHHRRRLAPDRFILSLLVAEALLWLTDRPGWPVWHKGYAVLTASFDCQLWTLAPQALPPR